MPFAPPPMCFPYSGKSGIVELCGVGFLGHRCGMTTSFKGAKKMTKVEELEMAITSLPEEDYSRIRQWFLERD